MSAPQCSLFPLRCPCGDYPVERDGEVFNWCRCLVLVVFGSVAEWNEWVMTL